MLNRSLAQRGYYQTHCFVTVLGRTRERPECILFNDTLRVALDEACANIPHGRTEKGPRPFQNESRDLFKVCF